MLESRLSNRSLDSQYDLQPKATPEAAKTAKARASATAAARRKGGVKVKSRVTLVGLLEALAAIDANGEQESPASVAVDTLTKDWSELPKGVTSPGFLKGLQNTLESLRNTDGDREPSAAYTSLLPECMKIIEEEIEMARYVDIYRKALRKA